MCHAADRIFRELTIMQAVNEPNVKHFDIAVVIHPTDTLLECSFSSCVALDAIVSSQRLSVPLLSVIAFLCLLHRY